MRTTIATFFTILVGLCPSQVESAMNLVTGPQHCHPINPRQAEAFEFRENGLINRDNRVLFITCSAFRSQADIDAQILIRVVNVSSFSETIECVFREIDLGFNQVRAIVRSATLSSGISTGLSIQQRMVSTNHYYSVTCRLPPNTGIGLMAQTLLNT